MGAHRVRFFFMLGLLSVTGCVMGTQRDGRIIAVEDVARVVVGTTTKQEVLELFGPPNSFKRLREELEADFDPDERLFLPLYDENVYIYEYSEDSETFFSAALLYTYFNRERLADRLMVIFDDDDVVAYLAFSKQTDAVPEPEP